MVYKLEGASWPLKLSWMSNQKSVMHVFEDWAIYLKMSLDLRGKHMNSWNIFAFLLSFSQVAFY